MSSRMRERQHAPEDPTYTLIPRGWTSLVLYTKTVQHDSPCYDHYPILMEALGLSWTATLHC